MWDQFKKYYLVWIKSHNWLKTFRNFLIRISLYYYNNISRIFEIESYFTKYFETLKMKQSTDVTFDMYKKIIEKPKNILMIQSS